MMSHDQGLQYLPERQVPAGAPDLLARQRGLSSLLAFLVATPLAAVLLSLPFTMTEPKGLENVLLYGFVVIGGIPSLIIAWIALWTFRSTLKPSNWVLRAHREGLYVKFRSLHNHHFPADDPIVLLIPRHAVAWLRGHRREGRREGSQQGESYGVKESFLEIKLKAADTAELARRLAGEGRHRAGWTARHAPLRLAGDGLLRIDWRVSQGALAPNIDQAMRILSRSYPAHLPETSRETPAADLDRAGQEARIVELMQRGERIQAIKLTRRLYGMSTTEAHTFVNGLVE